MDRLPRTDTHGASDTAILDVRRSRILVADGDDGTLHSIAEALRREGYEVLESKSGVELMEYVVDYLLRPDRFAPDAIVTSLSLAGVSGLAILEGVRAFDGELPFFVTAAMGDRRAETARRLGASILYRPLDVDVLVALVQVAIRHRDAVHGASQGRRRAVATQPSLPPPCSRPSR